MNKILESFQGKIFKNPPVWFMRQAGRYLPEYHTYRKKKPDFMEFCSSADLAIEVTLQPIRRFDFDAAIIFSDILMIPHALGQKVTFVPEKGPQLEAMQDFHDVENLNYDRFQHRIMPTLEALRGVRAQLAPEKALIGFAGAPWTVMAYMIEGKSSRSFDRVTAFAHQEPEAFEKLIHLIQEATVIYLEAQVKAGAQVLQLFESWAGLCPQTLFEKAILEPTRYILRELQNRCPEIPLIGFAKGLGTRLALYHEKLPFQGLTLDPEIEPTWAQTHLQSCPVLQGGLDPLLLIEGGDKLEKATRRYLEVFHDRPYIFNLGHGILPQTPLENVQKVLDLVRENRP